MVVVTPTTSASKRGRMLEAVGFHAPTTMRDVAARAGFSYAEVNWHLHKLRDLGLVAWVPRRARTVRLTAAGETPVRERLSA